MLPAPAGKEVQAQQQLPIAADSNFWEPGCVDANMHEVLFSTLLLLSAGNSVASIESWAKKVRADRERALELRGLWKPLTEGANGFGRQRDSERWKQERDCGSTRRRQDDDNPHIQIPFGVHGRSSALGISLAAFILTYLLTLLTYQLLTYLHALARTYTHTRFMCTR